MEIIINKSPTLYSTLFQWKAPYFLPSSLSAVVNAMHCIAMPALHFNAFLWTKLQSNVTFPLSCTAPFLIAPRPFTSGMITLAANGDGEISFSAHCKSHKKMKEKKDFSPRSCHKRRHHCNLDNFATGSWDGDTEAPGKTGWADHGDATVEVRTVTRATFIASVVRG